MFHVIDDDKELAGLIVELLESFGFEATAYHEPVSYLEYVFSPEYQEPLATFTDIRMPKINGYQLMKEIKQKLPDHKFIALSGYNDCEEYARKTACHFLSKPFQPEKLIEVAQAIKTCSEDGYESASPSCNQALQESDWRCPLDCLECNRN